MAEIRTTYLQAPTGRAAATASAARTAEHRAGWLYLGVMCLVMGAFVGATTTRAIYVLVVICICVAAGTLNSLRIALRHQG